MLALDRYRAYEDLRAAGLWRDPALTVVLSAELLEYAEKRRWNGDRP